MLGVPVNAKTLVAQRLNTYPELTALVAGRVYPGEAPQNAALPFVVYHQVDKLRDRTLTGASRLATPRIQVDVYTAMPPSTAYGQADAIAIAVRHALDDYEGLGHVGEREGREPETDRWRISQDYMGLLTED